MISGNLYGGLDLGNGSPTPTGNRVEGNDIGTDASATLVLPNGSNGAVFVSNQSGDVIGGTGAGQANVIANNTGPGLTVARRLVAHYSSATDVAKGFEMTRPLMRRPSCKSSDRIVWASDCRAEIMTRASQKDM